jgi:hypothetical protein
MENKDTNTQINSLDVTVITATEKNSWKFLQAFRKKIDHPRLQQYNH